MGQGTQISVGDNGLVGYVDSVTPPPRGRTAVPQQTPTPRRLAAAAATPPRWPAGPRSSSEIRDEGDDSRFAVSFTDEAVTNGSEGRTPGGARNGHRACRHVRARLARGQPDPLDPLAQAGAEAADREARYAALWLAIELRWDGGDTDTWSPPLNPAAGGGVVGRGANGLGRNAGATTSSESAPVAHVGAASVAPPVEGPKLCRRCLLDGVSVPIVWRCPRCCDRESDDESADDRSGPGMA